MGQMFEKLESLRLLSRGILASQSNSLRCFNLGDGFGHILSSEGPDPSVTSSATCALSLVATSSWADCRDQTQTTNLLKYLISRDESAGLEPGNPFTNAWILEAVTALDREFANALEASDIERIKGKELRLQSQLTKDGVSIEPYPGSAYLTQLVLRVLKSRGKLKKTTANAVQKWAWAELTKQLALIQADSKAQDAFAVAYLLITVTVLTPRSKISPEQASIQRLALKTFFDCQLKDGTWPLSRPLFVYPEIGNAHCFEYEMLVQLFQTEDLSDLLFDYLDKIALTANSAANNAYRLEPGILVWSSGHHPQLGKPESWATASVYHFFYALDRLLVRWVRRELFRFLELPLPAPDKCKSRESDFASDVIDSSLSVKNKVRSLKKFLWEEFVKPISAEVQVVEKGGSFSLSTPRSAILFGPPGTSKTDLSIKIASFLGWSYLSIDPSTLLRHGMEGIQAEANMIFRMLNQTDSLVVLFDEFDELVRERESAKAEQPFSRLLTTAMLPKLAAIHRRGALVFIIATNDISGFDLAISREGRIDRVVQVLPPTYKAKMKFKKWGPEKVLDFQTRFRELSFIPNSNMRRQLADLTFGECQSFASDLMKANDSQEAISKLNEDWKKCTLQRPVLKAHIKDEDQTTWKDRCEKERKYNR
jgi:hypothetical protein